MVEDNEDKAIYHYRKVWKYAQEAIKHGG